MRASVRHACVVAIVLVIPVIVSAQWPPHLASGVPKTPDGKSDQFFGQITGQPPFELFAASEREFF
jgi:hypothetical protein